MEHRTLGHSGIAIPPLMFGGNVFGWTADEATSFRLLDRLREAGLTAIDTADVYSAWAPGHQGGESETVIGKWLAMRGGREKIVLATKVGKPIGGRQGLSRTWITQAIDDSLRRLQTDYVDIYFAHDDDQTVPLEESLGAFASLIEAGKVRAIGASNYTAARLRQALQTSATAGLPRYEMVQPLYNLVERPAFEAELEPLCAAEELGVVTYFALAAGFLTGKYRSEADLGKSPRGQRMVGKYINPRGLKIIAALEETASRLSATPAQVALAWVMARPTVTAAIASASKLDQLVEIAAATELRLDPDAMETLDRASA
ncbi:MAG: aldo/keto reductase [Acetobacteraceae bacterium]|nr:aldo/keto reductase [Acetobacteraceae bacterium]